MESYERLLLANRAWVKERVKVRSDYFARSADTQTPEFLWIGCSDSRVPSEEITGAEPGELFVQRNVANLVLETDFNLFAVLQYSVEVLKVKHIIVCGHYNCGGVKHAMAQPGFGPVNKWLAPLNELYLLHKDQIESITDPQGRWDRLVEINVTEQVKNLARTDIVQRAWWNERLPMLHGWIYNLRTGYLNELILMQAGDILSRNENQGYSDHDQRNSRFAD
jgi:carbonic anhydrase